jgi:hypothetical protein
MLAISALWLAHDGRRAARSNPQLSGQGEA